MPDKDLVECLLTREEIDEATFGKEGYDFNIAHAQLDKAIPIIRKAVLEECLQDKIEYGESTYESGYAMAKQEVAEEIKKELWEWSGKKCTEHDGNIVSYGAYRDSCRKCHDKFFERYGVK